MRHAAFVVGAVALLACDDHEDRALDGGEARDAPRARDTDPLPDVLVSDAGPVPDGATRFVLRIENVAGPSFPTALGAGVAVVHASPDPLFTEGAPDRGDGLEALAEDGDPRPLAAALAGGVFPALAPGVARDIVVDARLETPRVSFATMVVESNDVFLAPDGDGIALFDESGRPLPARDVTHLVHVWNAGTEIDQAPGLGPMQAPRQHAPGSGAAESSLRPFADGTRALPLARDLVRVRASVEDRRVTLTFENVSEERGLLVTRLSPIFWAVHDGTLRLFEEGARSPENGLEALAEDGDARPLASWAASQRGVRGSGVADRALATGRVGMVQPGDRVAISVHADDGHSFLSVASMIAATNDAFLAFPSDGICLVRDDGEPRDATDLEREILRSLVVWDAGTEANEVPGAGLHAGPRPDRADYGDPDADPRVRRYDDITNDVAQDGLGALLGLGIRHVAGRTFEVTIANHSGDTPFPLLVTAFAYALHEDGVQLFDPAAPPSPGLVALAEDCVTGTLRSELERMPGVAFASVASTPVGATESSPLRHGERYVFMVAPDTRHRRLSLAAMPYPSNDMVVAFDPEGLALLDAAGLPRSDDAILADVRRMFRAWDVGSEANQAGGAGRDAVPLQTDYDTGAPEGDGTVRREADPIWSYPTASELARVTITPFTRD